MTAPQPTKNSKPVFQTTGNPVDGIQRHVEGYEAGAVFRVTDPTRVGNSWLHGRIFRDDLAMVVSKSGDCFYYFMLVERFANCTGLIRESKFGAYAGLGQRVPVDINDEHYATLVQGKKISLVIGDCKAKGEDR